MKLTAIKIQNVLGVRSADIAVATPVALIAGANYAGKSSIREAVRMALTGETVRVDLKKDYGKLVSDGAESGFVAVEWAGGEASVVLPRGERHLSGEQVHGALPYVLDAQRFTRLDENARRAFLFGLMGLKADGAAVKERLTARGCNPAKVEATMPLLRAGFAAACDEAKNKARDAKAAWRTVTGETYGEKKAAGWQAQKPAYDAALLEKARAELRDTEAEIERAAALMGDLEGQDKRYREHAGKLSALRETAGRYARIQDKLNKDEAELKQWQEKVAALKDSMKSQDAIACPDCGVMLVVKDGALVHAAPMAKGTEDDLARMPEYEKAMRLMENCVANGKRDLAASDAAAKELKALEEAGIAEPPDAAAVDAARASLTLLRHDKANHEAAIRLTEEAERQASAADKKTEDATRHHADVEAWIKIADALSPDGIPGDMLAEALAPINARLAQSAADAQWPEMQIGKDMSVTANGRDYAMLSESEKWRADAMIAEAIAHLSGLKLLVLDRFDVLDLRGRADLMAWLDILTNNGELDTALVFGTLKALPAQLPATVGAHWIESGVVGQIKVAA